MNNRGQLQIIAAMLVAVILVGTIMVTFSQLRNSSIQKIPQILSATDEIQLAINQILCTTIRYYGSVLQVTGNSSYARNAAQIFLYNQTANIPSMYPAWGISLNVTGISLRVNWFSNYSYSNGTLSMTYDLKGLGLSNISYNSSSSLVVQANSGATIGQASLTISEDAGSPVTNLGTQNFGFYSYNYTNSTWNVINPSAFSATFTNGTYAINLPQGVDSNAYIVQVIDQRGLMVLSSSSNYLASGLNWNASLNSYAHYVDVSGTDVDLNGEFGSHSNFTVQQYGPDTSCDTLTEGPVTSTQSNAYYPSNFILRGLTQNVAGSLTDLQTDNSNYMGFSSWASATSATSLYSQQTTTSVGNSSYYTLGLANASQAGLTLTASMSSVGRTLLGKLVYPLTGANTINASIWTAYYRAWMDASTQGSITNNPSSTSGGWTNPTYAYADGGGYAYSAVDANSQVYGGYGFSIPSGAQIIQVRVRLDAWSNGNDDTRLEVSTNGGISWLATSQTIDVAGSETPYWVNVTSWTSWTPTAINNNNIRARVTQVRVGGQDNTQYLDYIPIEVTYATALAGHCDVDILIRKSDGTIRTTVTTSNAASGPLTSQASTLSGTYAWSNYSVVAQTDYLEFDFYANTTTALASATAYLMIDNSTLALAQQTHIDNVCLPSQYTSAVVFEGVSDSQAWTQLNWTINSQCTTAGVTVTCQLYNFNTSSYPTSGNGYQTTTVGTTDVTQSQTISTNPTYYRNGTNWVRIIVQCVKTTTAQFYWNCDLVQFLTNYTTTNYRLDLEERWTNVDYNNTDQLAIYEVGSISENMEVDFWNGIAWNPVIPSLASGWNNASVSSYMTSSNFTIRFLDGNVVGDTIQNSWQIDVALVRTNFIGYTQLQNATMALELLQNGTTLWLGQPLANLASRPIPPIAVKAFHVNQTINGVEREMPFQIEDWASNYRVPLGLSSNVSIFSDENMLVCLVTPKVTAIKVWWNGSDDAVQTPLAYTNQYFTANTTQRTVSNRILNLTLDFPQLSSGVYAFHVISTVGNSTCTSELFRINSNVSSYGNAEPNYAITNGPVRVIIHHEVEWSSNGVPNCYDTLAHLVITLPANATYYTYALRLMFLNTTTTRTITDLCPIKLTSTINTIQTENGTASGYPIVTNTTTTGLFYNLSQAVWAHHWSQFISGTKGAGIMFTDVENQKLYVFDGIAGAKTGALRTNSTANKIELLPVVMSPVSLLNAFDVTWHGAIVTFDETTPIYEQATRNGLWIIVEYPPSLT